MSLAALVITAMAAGLAIVAGPYWEQKVLLGSLIGGIGFLIAAVSSGRRRLLLFLGSILLLQAAWEWHEIAWEKTVHAPIRVDLLLEIPAMFVCLIWGVVSGIHSVTRPRLAQSPEDVRTDTEAGGAADQLDDEG